MALKMDILASDRWFTNADYQINFQIFQDDEVTPQDISGWTFSWVVKKRKTDVDASALLAKASGGDGIEITSAATGIGRVEIDAADTADLRGATYWHELKRTGTGVGTVNIQGLAVLQKSTHE